MGFTNYLTIYQVADWNLVGKIQAAIELFDSVIFFSKSVITLAQAVLYRKRALKNYAFEYRWNNNNSGSLRHF